MTAPSLRLLWTGTVTVCYAAGQDVSDTARHKRVSELAQAIEKRPTGTAILELGRIGTRNEIPFLRSIRDRLRDAPPERLSDREASEAAQMAMAKLGDNAAFQEILEELRNPNQSVQQAVFNKFKYIRNKEVFRELYRLLDDDHDRGGRGDQVFWPFSYFAMQTLAETVPNPPIRGLLLPSKENVAIWKKWFQDHPEWIK